MQKFLCVFMTLLFLFTMSVPVMAAQPADAPYGAELVDGNLTGGGSSEGGSGNVFSAILKNLKSITADEMLKIPANAMADVMTLVFQVLQMFGKILSAIGITGRT